MSTQTFADLGVSDAVCGALRDRGISQPFPIQELVVGDVLAGRDVLVQSPTGSGKTLAFGVPIIDRVDPASKRPSALVLAPTRELALQIAAELRTLAAARSLRVGTVYGGVGLAKQGADARRSHIVVATPGRLEDQLARGALTLDGIGILVLDEADRMLDMGFRPAIDRIVRRCPRERQTLFFSATLDGVAADAASEYTTRPVRRTHRPEGESRTAIEIEHRFIAIEEENRTQALVEELAADRALALVFVRTKRGADRLVTRLGTHGVTAAAIHGNKSQRQREHALARFASGHVDTLVATDIAARGIDVSGISHVINFDPPHDHEAYIHRLGRTARAGRTGIGITLVGARDRADLGKLAARLGITEQFAAAGGPAPAPDRQAGRPRSDARRHQPDRPARRRRRRTPAA